MQMRSTRLLCGLFFCSLFMSQQVLANELSERLQNAAENHEQVITRQLASSAPQEYPDWLVLAQAYLSADNKDAALQALQQASKLAATSQQNAHVALLRAKVYGILFRDTPNAISFLEQAETLLQGSTGKAEQQLLSEVLTNFAQAHNQLGDLAKAEYFASQSLELAISLADPAKELAARLMLGRLALQNNRFNQAHQQMQQAMILAEKLGDTEARASIYFRLGMAFRKIDEHALALEHLQQAAALYQSQNNLSSYSYALVYIAESYLENPEGIAQAEQHLLQALAISKQINNVMRTAIVKQSLGRASKLRGDNRQAAEYYNDALQQFRQIGAQTYVQESALALAELLFLQQQFGQSQQLVAELSPAIDDAANYLQARYYDLSARLAEQQQNWQQAYLLQQQASKLQFTELTATTTEKLNELKNNLSQSNARQDSEAELLTAQLAMRSTLRHWQVTVLVFAVLFAFIAYLYWQQRNHLRQRQPLHQPLLPSQSWSRFCEKLQQDGRNKQPLHLIAIALEQSQQLKLNVGEATFSRPVQTVLHNLPDLQLAAYCINSDVLWLGYRAGTTEVTHVIRQLEHDIQQALAQLTTTSRLISLQLDVAQLLGPRWQAVDLAALREALWLGWKLASLLDDDARCWHIQLSAEQPRPCEWRSSNIRLDMINALQLGALKLTVNQEAVPGALSGTLVMGATEASQ